MMNQFQKLLSKFSLHSNKNIVSKSLKRWIKLIVSSFQFEGLSHKPTWLPMVSAGISVKGDCSKIKPSLKM